MPSARRQSSLASLFYAGRYAEIVAATFDDTKGETRVEDADFGFVVGALTFLGRPEDARIFYDGGRRSGATPKPARAVAIARFFLGLAAARSGNFDQAARFLVHDARARVRSGDPWIAAVAFQGLACQRYFTGRYRAAAQHSLRALRAAHLAHFAYAKMLSTDLRGHALVQLGAFRSGITLLEQAKRHAQELGFEMNVYAIDCSIASYSARFLADAVAVEKLERLLAKRTHDSYSRRALETELAIQLALRGRRTLAVRALESAERDALRVDGRRAKVAALLARLHVTRFSEGARACAALLPQVATLIDPSDIAFRAELLGFEVFVARALGDEGGEARALDSLRILSNEHQHYQSRAALEQFDTTVQILRPFPEDERTAILRAIVARDQQVLPRLMARGMLGPIPELLGFSPGRRIIVLLSENALLLEDHGDIALTIGLPRWCPTLLRALARGSASKEQLVERLWGLRTYRPERHDPLVRTTIHRLRAILAPHGRWIEVIEDGYGSAVPIHFIGAADALDEEIPLVHDEMPEARATGAIVEVVDKEAIVLGKLEELGKCSVRDVARSLGISQSTALRALQSLHMQRKVVRTGVARATRYAVRR